MAAYQRAPLEEPLSAVKRGSDDHDDLEAERDKNYDPELKIYGGKYDKKFAIGQVTIRLPEKNVINWIALLYGFLPFIVPGMLFIDGFILHHFMSKFGFSASIICVVVNELFFKPIIKDPRPSASANKYKDGTMKPGMPSGHVLNAFTLLVWSLGELAFAVDAHDEKTRLEWFAIIVFVMLPVPWARWHNRDHSFAQCLVSMILGTITGISAVWVRKKYFPHHWQPWEVELFR